MFAQLFLQITFIVLPILIYYSLLKNHLTLKKYKTVLSGLLCGLSILLCMAFPISFITGNMMDLRSIPWMIAFLYGSFPLGIILTISMFVYRFLIGGMGMYVVFIAYSISTIGLYLFFKNYLHFTLPKKMKTGLTFICFNAVLIVVCIQTIFRFSSIDVVSFYAFFILMHLVIAWIAIYLIETFRENERLQLEVQKAEKLNVVGQMAASVAHEIRNPMTVVLGFIQLLHKDPETSEKHKKHFKIMQVEMERAESIIKDYLSLAKPQSENLEKIEVAEQLNSIKQTLSHYSTLNGVTIEYETSQYEDYYVYGSKEKLQQVLVNIIKNAIEVSHKGDSVHVTLLKERGTITVSIKDNGPGMTSEQLAKLGTPFYSTKDKGTGLGLSVCYSIVHSMNGTIDVQSEVNKGSIFKIRLPNLKEEVI